MFTVTVAILFYTILSSTSSHGAGRSVCQESKKLYPGDCRLFYKCVPLPGSAQAYVWVPSRCTAGLIFDQRRRRCVLAEFSDGGCKTWIWPGGDSGKLDSFYSLVSAGEGGMEMTDYPATSTVQTDGISTSRFNDDDKSLKINSVSSSADANKDVEAVYSKNVLVLNRMDANSDSLPLSAVNSPPLDAIDAQMHRLTQLINDLKAAFSTQKPTDLPTERSPVLDLNFPSAKAGVDLLPDQIYKITAQLIFPTPRPRPSLSIADNLYKKYLTNPKNTFLKEGEFFKATAVNKLLVVGDFRPTPPRLLASSSPSVPHQSLNWNECRVVGERLANPRNCTKYFICKEPSTGAKLSFNCPSKTAFSKLKEVCDLEEFMRCQQN